MKRVLVVDDDPLWRSILSREAENAGMHAESLSSWTEAGARLKGHDRAYNLLVVDLFESQKPWSEGLLLLRDLRGGGIQTPVIVVSGDDKVDLKLLRELFHEYGIFDYFKKDADTSAFRRSVEKVRGADDTSLNRVRRICERFHLVAIALSSRRQERPTITIADEYDVQDLLRAMLILDFDDVRAEEPVPSFAGSASRADFLLKREKIIVEAKKTRRSLGPKEISDQLIVDIARYRSHPDCNTLVCFVYDPEQMIGNAASVEADLARLSELNLRVVPIIAPRSP